MSTFAWVCDTPGGRQSPLDEGASCAASTRANHSNLCRDVSGRIITLEFGRLDLGRRGLSVHLIKKRIQQFEAIPFSQQQLILNDHVLVDGESLHDYDKLEGSSLHLVVMTVNGSSHDDIQW